MRDRARTKERTFAAAALAVQCVLASRLRLTAWPEVTTPAYLWSRGMLLYRDIHFIHTPGMIGLLALLFRVFGPGTFALRLLALSAALFAHWTLLSRTRNGNLTQRLASSLFFLALFYLWQGNSVWPSPIIAALALPLASALDEEKPGQAGWLLGFAILLKQTAAYCLIAVVIARVVAGRKAGNTARIAAIAAVPYAAAFLAFAMLGAGRDFIEWTLVAPFVMGRTIANHPGFAALAPVAVAFVPLTASVRTRASRWPLVVGVGLVLMVLPRFSYLQAIPAVPCMALGAYLWMRQVTPSSAVGRLARAWVWAAALSTAAIVAIGETWDGRIEYWNDDPAFNRLVDRVREMPPGPLHSFVWANLLPRTGRLPPALLYALPWIYYFPNLDSIGDPIIAASRAPDAITVTPYFPGTSSERLGPYSIWKGDGDWYCLLPQLNVIRR